MKRLLSIFVLYFTAFGLYAQTDEDCNESSEEYRKEHCKNHHTKICWMTPTKKCPKPNEYAGSVKVDCGEAEQAEIDSGGDSPYSGVVSTVESLTYNYTHDVTEYSPSVQGVGCSSCSGGDTAPVSYKMLTLQRYHRFRQRSDRGSFGPGVFSNYDSYFTLYMHGSTPRVDMFFSSDLSMRRYFRQGNAFFETFSRSSKKLEIRKADGTATTDIALADHAVLEKFNGEIYKFEIFSVDEFTKMARLTSFENRNGYKIELTYDYEQNDESLTDPMEKFKINQVSDPNGRTLSFDYLSETRSGMWVVSQVTLPNNEVISYSYGSSADSPLTGVSYPDGTASTFSAEVQQDGQTKVTIFEAGEKGRHRNKCIFLDSNFNASAVGRDGVQYWNSASLLVNTINIGSGTDEEMSFGIFQNPNHHNNRRIYDGGNRLKSVNIATASYFKQWDVEGSIENFDSFKNLKTEESFTKGDWKFYLANAQGRPPIMDDKHGLKYRYLYNSDNRMTKKIYLDGTFEAWDYNEFNQKTRHRDRLGRATHWDYDSRGNLLRRTVGLRAETTGEAGEELAGLLCRVYDHTKTVLPTNFESLIPVETVSVPNLTLDVSDREDTYALLFTGELEITTPGQYTFFLSSDDGSKLSINGDVIIDNDGCHGLKELSNEETPLTLSAGKHSIRVEFFEKYGAQKLFLKYQGPDTVGDKVDIPDTAFTHTSVEEELAEVDVTTPDTAEYSFTYYPSGHANQFLLHTETDANGNVTEYIYNSDNLLTEIKTPTDDGTGQITKSSFTYDSAKRLKTSTDAEDRTTEFFYDSRDRVVKILYNDDSTEIFFFGTGIDSNLLVKQKDRNGNTTTFDYNSRGQVVTTIRAYSVMSVDGTSETVNPSSLQSIEECTYAPGLDLKASCTIDGELTEYFYDYRNRLVETRKHADNNSILVNKTFYKNNLTQFTEDPYGRRTYFSYRITGADKSDTAMTRMVQETIPGSINLPNGYYSDINNIDYDHSNNAPYLLTKYEKDAQGQTTAVIDPREIRHESVFDFRGRKTLQINDSEGLAQTVQTIYDANSNIIGIIKPRYFDSADGALDGEVREYTSRNLLKSRTVAKVHGENLTSAIEATEHFTYYDDGRKKDHTDFRGNTSTTVWHQCCGRLQASIDQEGNQVVSNNDYFGNVTHTAVVDHSATITNYHDLPDNTDGQAPKTLQEITTRFDGRHRPIARTVWLQSLGYVDPNDVPIATDPTEGLTTTYEYFDDLGDSQLTEIVAELSADGILLGAPHADVAQGSAVITTNPEGEKSISIMDGTGRVAATGALSKTDGSLVSWSTVTHDNVVNNLLETKKTSALGFENKVQTDGAGRRVKAIDAEGNISEFEYDNNSNLVYSQDANGVERTCDFDNLNRDVLCKDRVEDGLGVNRQKSYDLNNNIIKTVDAKGQKELFSYDDRNRRTNHWDRLETSGNGIANLPAVADSTQYFYDANSNLEKITDVQGNDTNYVFDVRNLNTKITYEDGGSTSCSYDALGRKDVCTDQLGDTVTYNYDMASRLLTREYHLGGTNLESTDTFTYDKASRIKTAHKGRYDNTCSYTYDSIGRKYTESLSIGSDTYTITYDDLTTTEEDGYDKDNRVVHCTYPDGTDVAKDWTDRNQLQSVDFDGNRVITSTYDAGGRESTRTFGNNLVNNMTYNLDNTRDQITVAGKADLSFTYGYDENKNVESESSTGSQMSGFGWDATFDEIDRVKTWQRDNGTDSQNWTLDNIGNWSNTNGSIGGAVFDDTRQHNGVHELTNMEGNNITYDDKGNMEVDANGNVLSWDIDNHLISFNAVTFAYDALGRRVEKNFGASSTRYIRNDQRVVEEYEKSGSSYNLARSYVYASYVDDLVAKIEASNDEVLYYHSDRQFNVRGLSDNNGNVKELYAYTTYGKQEVLSSSTSSNNNYGYTGRYLDNETGLWYFRARYFSDEMGRFISRDPLEYVDGMSMYGGYFAQRQGLDPRGTIWVPLETRRQKGREYYEKKFTYGYNNKTINGKCHIWLTQQLWIRYRRDDTLFDIEIYVTVLEHIDEHGQSGLANLIPKTKLPIEIVQAAVIVAKGNDIEDGTERIADLSFDYIIGNWTKAGPVEIWSYSIKNCPCDDEDEKQPYDL